MSWRADVLRLCREGRRLERIARLTELPLEVRPQWPGLDWAVWDETIETFSARVKLVAARLGAPESVNSDYWVGAYANDVPPDLIARWQIDDSAGPVKVTVRALHPRGCKVKPGSEYRKEEPEIHPECAAVLRELEDL